MDQTTFNHWLQAIRHLNVIVFRGETEVSEVWIENVLRQFGVSQYRIVSASDMGQFQPKAAERVAHIYGFIGAGKADSEAFMQFARQMMARDSRPHYFVMSDQSLDVARFFMAMPGHIVIAHGFDDMSLMNVFLESAHKVVLQEKSAHWHKQWLALKASSDELNAETFRMHQEQNDVIRMAKLLGEKLNSKDVTQTACQLMIQVFQIDAAGFFRYDESDDTLRLEHVDNLELGEKAERGIDVGIRGKRHPLQYFEEFCKGDGLRAVLTEKHSDMKLFVHAAVMKGAPMGMFFFMNSQDMSELQPHLLEQFIQTFLLSYQNAVLHEKISNLAIRDGLTGLYNVRYFHERINAEFNRMGRLKHSLGLIFLDIDNFKHYNDTNGHPNGDKVIQGVAQCIRSVFRPTDIIARYGGEEFVIAMPHSDLSGSLSRAEDLRALIEETPFPFEETQPLKKVTVSIGVSAFPEISNEAPVLIKAADDALYKAKEGGRNRVVVAEALDDHVPLFQAEKAQSAQKPDPENG